jgi:hypothetical protein
MEQGEAKASPPSPPQQDPPSAPQQDPPSPPGTGFLETKAAAAPETPMTLVANTAADSNNEWTKAFDGWRDSIRSQYASAYPAELKDAEAARATVSEGWRVEMDRSDMKGSKSFHFNHFEECAVGPYDQAGMQASGLLRTCSELSRWCAAYDPAVPRERYQAPWVHGSARSWIGNFRTAYRVRANAEHLTPLVECQQPAGFKPGDVAGCQGHQGLPDEEIAEMQPMKGNAIRDSLICPNSKTEQMVPAVLGVMNALGLGVCVKNASIYPTRSWHMCEWGFSEPQDPCQRSPGCPLLDEVMHIAMEDVNKGEFGHHIEQAFIPLLVYVDWLKAHPDVKVTLHGATAAPLADGTNPHESLIQYFEAVGIDRSRLVDLPYSARVSWVVRWTDLAGDQGLFWGARAAAWHYLGFDKPDITRVLCPGVERSALDSVASVDAVLAHPACVFTSDSEEEHKTLLASPFAGGPTGLVPEALYRPSVDVPVLVLHRSAKRAIVNEREFLSGMANMIAQEQARPEHAHLRLRMLLHNDKPEHNTDKRLVLGLFAQARVVVGVHGAGLTHKFMMRPRSACVEILTTDPPGYQMTGWVLMATSARAGLEHHAVTTPANHKKDDAYTVDVALTVKAARQALMNVIDAEAMRESLTM